MVIPMQGSILGPLYDAISYVNDLPTIVKSSLQCVILLTIPNFFDVLRLPKMLENCKRTLILSSAGPSSGIYHSTLPSVGSSILVHTTIIEYGNFVWGPFYNQDIKS